MRNTVLNNTLGFPHSFDYPKLTREKEQELLAILFEQLLIFDTIVISTNRLNSALIFLIQKLGLNTVERLFDNEYVKIMIWTPVLFTGSGRKMADGTIDQSVMYKQPPIAAASLSAGDLDPERHIESALSHFAIQRDRKRILTKSALKNYIVPDGMYFSTESANLVIDAYRNNILADLGLACDREPNMLELDQRTQLIRLGHKVIETALLSKYNYKSYENYEHYSICKQNNANIGKAYKISQNSDVLFDLEGLANLKQLFIEEKLSFEDALTIRNLASARYYRKWINNVGESCSGLEITREYLNQIKGSSKFFETSSGKFIKTLGLYGINAAISTEIIGLGGLATGLGLGLLENFWLDNFLKGRNPSMFINKVKDKIIREENAL